MTDQVASRLWALVIRVPKTGHKDADELLFSGSQVSLLSDGYLSDTARTDLPGSIDRVLEDHRRKDMPFSVVVFDAFSPSEAINQEQLKQLIRELFSQVPVVLVSRKRGERASNRKIRVIPWSQEKGEFLFPGEVIPDAYLPEYLSAKLAH